MPSGYAYRRISPLRTTEKWVRIFYGGLEEIRTPDPYNANVVRSQLRYEPVTLQL